MIRLPVGAKHVYHLQAALRGSRRSLSDGNVCTMWFEDTVTGTKIGDTERWLNGTVPFGPPPAATGEATAHVH